MQNAINNNPQRLKFLEIKFYDEFLESLGELEWKASSHEEVVEKIVDKINQTKPLRDDFVSFFEILIESGYFSVDNIIDFLEKAHKFTDNHKHFPYTYDGQFDHYKFLLGELVIYVFMYLNKYKMYDEMQILLREDLNLSTSSYQGRPGIKIEVFRTYLSSLDRKNEVEDLRRTSLHGDLLNKRAGRQIDDLSEADLLLYFFTENSPFFKNWMPYTSIYYKDRNIKLISKMVSKSHFDKVKGLFYVQSVEELKQYFKNFEVISPYKNNWAHSLPTPRNFINIDEIATQK